MKILQWIEEETAALPVRATGALLAAVGAHILTILLGAQLFRDEWSYGIRLPWGFRLRWLQALQRFSSFSQKIRSVWPIDVSLGGPDLLIVSRNP
jgi:hypothetical protein